MSLCLRRLVISYTPVFIIVGDEIHNAYMCRVTPRFDFAVGK